MDYDVAKDLKKLKPVDVNTDADHGFDVRITALEESVDTLETAAANS